MELIERYLQAVKFALPRTQQEDIVRELRDSILSQIEEKESALGRPLTDDEQVEMLKKLGSPMHLASRYRKQQMLIGAAIFPVYWKVLKMALGVAFLVQAAGTIATAVAGKPFSESLKVLFHYPSVALTVFAWVTVVFAAGEFFGAKFRFSDRWDPRTLAPLVKHSSRKSRIELIAQLVIQTIFGVWWLAGLHYQYLILGPGIAYLNFGPVWHKIYPLFVVMVLMDLAFTSAMLLRPHWQEGRRVSRVVMSGLGLIVLYFLIKAPELFVAAPGAESQGVATSVNFGLHLGLEIALVVNIINIGLEVARWAGRRLDRARQATVG
jgi:hypothetical protein